jgi:hypothetical protein
VTPFSSTLKTVTLAIAAAVLVAVQPATIRAAQAKDGRFLAKEDILLYGIGLKIEPAQQTVPKDIATIVSTMLVAPETPQNLPPFGPDAMVRATLRGPSFQTPLELSVKPNTPFSIPPLTVAGKHTLDNIRLVSAGEVVLRGMPESTVIDVIDRLLITEVTARPLTAAEIREQRLVFDASSFQAYNFAAAFAIQDKKIPINFTVVLPSVLGANDVSQSEVRLPTIGAQPGLPSLQTVIPDTLKRLQTQIPNLSVQGFTLKVPSIQGQNFVVPPIPGVVVIPGDIGFLNQFFNVMLMVGNVAPPGSNLVVTDLKAEIVLPTVNSSGAGSANDPLRMGRTDRGEVPRIQPVVQAGSDGRLGTADDVLTLGPGETANAEWLVEGRREGSHIIEMQITGTLRGLPIGPVPVTGRAKGSVLVRNPTFTLTFTHPEVVTAGESYSLGVTVTNTSAAPANLVSLNLYPGFVSGATIVGSPTRQIETIAPGDSESVSFDLVAKVSGKVTAATLDTDDEGKVQGRFALETSVGELGIPLSPDSLVLPRESDSLPPDLRTAAIGLLGKAYAAATAPALPTDVKRFSKKLVWDHAVDVASAGLRVTLHEPVRDSATQLLMDFMGSRYPRLAESSATPEDLAFAKTDYEGFDDLRRRSVRGDIFADAVAALMRPSLVSMTAAPFHHDVAQKISYRPGHISVLIAGGTQLPFAMSLVDAAGRRLGGAGADGKIVKGIPFGDYLQFATPGSAPTAQMAIVAAPAAGTFTIRLDRVAGVPDSEPFTLSVVAPDAQGHLRQFVFENLTALQTPVLSFDPADPYRLSVDAASIGGATVTPTVSTIVDPPPSILGAVQQIRADQVCVDPGKSEGLWRPGRIVAVLFSEEVTAQSVQDKFKADEITHWLSSDNKVVGVALQPDRRVAFVALRDPVGPIIVPRTISIQDVADTRGQSMTSGDVPIEITAVDEGAQVSGRVLRADGSPVPFANVRLFYGCPTADDKIQWIGISAKSADSQGRYSWDYVLESPRIVAIDPDTDEFRDVQFTVARHGQRLNVDIVLLGRGTLVGRTLGESGQPLKDTFVRITSLTDQSQYAAKTDAAGRFTVARIPVGNVFIEAVNADAHAQIAISDHIPFAGATTTRDLVLLTADSPKQIVLKKGTVTGHVVRGAGTEPLGDLPVTVIYVNHSQPGVNCPVNFPAECPVAIGKTDATGGFTFAGVPAGQLRVESFDQATLQEGSASLQLAENAVAIANVVITGGLGIVEGDVVDAANHKVPGARIGGGRSLTTADPDGHFTLKDVPLGRREIVAVSDALGTTSKAIVDLTRAGETVPVRIVLEPVGKVAGTLFRADGATVVPGVSVYLYKLPIQNGMIDVVGQALSDESGHYQIPAVPAGAYKLTAFTADFSDGNVADVTVKFNGQIVKADLTFRGGNGGKVTGVVVDASNTPVKGQVSLSGDQPIIAGGRVVIGFEYIQNFQIVDTNFSTGAFSMAGLWPGTFTIRAAGQFSPDPIALQQTMPSPPTTMALTLKLQPTSQLTGKVLNADGTPVAAGTLVKYKSDEFKTFCSENAAGEQSCTSVPQGIQEAVAVTDATGTFLFAVVNAGNYTLTAFENGDLTGRTTRVRGSVRAGEKAEVSLKLPVVADLIVNVFASDTQTRIPNAKVEVKQLDYPNKKLVLQTGTAGEDLGVARFSGGDAFSEGAFLVTASAVQANGFAGVATGRIEHEGETVTLNVYLNTATGSVHGTVRRPDGSGAANAQVVVANSGGAIGFTLTDGNGAYFQDLIPVGPFVVDTFEAANAAHGTGSGQIFVANQDVPLDITEDPPAVVTGTVVEAGTLAPLKGWQVALHQTTASGQSISLRTTSGVDGGFSFPGAAVGTFTLTATKEDVQGQGSAQGQIVHAGQAVDVPVVVTITRQSFGRIEGVVLSAAGAPVANAKVCVGRCEDSQTIVTAGADGKFAVEHLPLGRWLLVAAPQTGVESGSATVSIDFDGDTATAKIALAGIGQISGTVLLNGNPAPGAKLTLSGVPDLQREAFADANGHFLFQDVSVKSFTIVAAAPPSFTTKGVVSDRLNPGESKDVIVSLEPTGTLTGRAVLEASGKPAAGVTTEIVIHGKHFFTETHADGTFAFDTLPLGPYSLNLDDSIGTGIARMLGTLIGVVALGDITLDVAAPVVVAMTPAPSATAVSKGTSVTLTFSEALNLAAVDRQHVTLSDANGPIEGDVEPGAGDKVVVFIPKTPLQEQTKYSVRATGLADRVGHVINPDFVASFTTADTIAPSTLTINPAPSTTGASIFTPVRIVFNEPIDPSKFVPGANFNVTTGGNAVAGRTDFIFGNTVVVFTPNLPFAEDSIYRVQSPAAVDLAGNAQAHGLDYTFTTTNRTPPVITKLEAANGGTVIENTVTTVKATPGAADVAYIDFFLNDVFTATLPAPYELAFQATPALGGPGQTIKVSAIATDTSGNRGLAAISTFVTVTPDALPAIAILPPAGGTNPPNGQHVDVTIHTTDDVGVAQVSFKAQTGKPADAGTHVVTTPVKDRSDVFGFTIPADAIPGSTIAVQASVTDTHGRTVEAAPLQLTVRDSIAPTVTITGATSGTQVKPGQQTTVIVSVQDAGAVRAVTFKAGGVTTSTQTRTIDPPQSSIVTSFTVTVPPGAAPPQSLTLDASAEDRAGNVGSATRVILPVGDNVAPIVTGSRTGTGRLQIVRGRSVTVVVDAEDDLGVSEIDLAGQGAFTVTQAKAIAPPLGTATASFTIQVPADATPGAVLTLQATAVDLAHNTSAPVVLALTVTALPEVTLPASVVVPAGESRNLSMQLSEPAPVGGLRVDLAADANVASVPASIVFAGGQSQATVGVTGVSGGTTTLDALIQGVQRGSATVVVEGGIVSGTIRDPQLAVVAGAKVTVTGGATPITTETDAQGKYRVAGIAGPFVSVKVLKDIDPTTRLLGFRSGSMNRPNGYFNADIVLMAAGLIHGQVLLPDGQTVAPDGVKVDLFEAANPSTPISTTFTHDGEYEFPLVAVGKYTVDASDANGNRGRASAEIASSGQDLVAPVTFVGRGSVTVTVKDAAGHPVNGATFTLFGFSVFGSSAPVSGTAVNGTFTVPNLFYGTFLAQAKDPATNQAGSISGEITAGVPNVTATLTLSSFAALQGIVYRADGVTTVPGATVSAFGNSTVTDTQGHYAFAFLPLGATTVSVHDTATRGIGFAPATLDQQGQLKNVDVTLLPQGTLIVNVQGANQMPVANASISINAGSGAASDVLTAVTGASGSAIVNHVIVGPFTVHATAANRTGTASGTLAAGEQRTVLVQLEPTAGITGIVRAPNDAPVSGGSVQVVGSTGYQVTVPIGADGTFHADNLNLASYTLTARDVAGRIRARVTDPIVLAVPNQEAQTTMTFVGLGTVGGRVINPDGSSAVGLSVLVRSLNAGFGGNQPTAVTNAGGMYSVANVPVGDVTISVANPVLHLRAEGTGTLTHDGEELTVPLLLQSNLIDLPATRWDANNFKFDVQKDGSILEGTSTVFTGTYAGTPWGGLQLEIAAGGTATRFAGAAVGTTEDTGREIAIHQDDLAGLSVTRKVFVPSGGYFARYLEQLTNPTSSPITVDVRVKSYLNRNDRGGDAATAIVTTSSGDDQLDVTDQTTRDRWVVVDDAIAGDPFLSFGFPATAFVFDGQGGARAADAAHFAAADPAIHLGPRALDYQWTSITIPPGATVGLLHFAVQETSRAGAQAAAQRLLQLPPEALAGLSLDELAQIQNFAPPLDGVSTLPALAPLTGTIAGRTLAADNTTAVAGATIRFQSTDALFGRTYSATSAPDGSFSFATAMTDNGSSRAVPVEAFTLIAGHATLGANFHAPPVNGDFTAGSEDAQQDVVFTNTGLARGVVRLNGAPVAGATVAAAGQVGGSAFDVTTQSGADGRYQFTLLPAGTFTFTATTTVQGTTVHGTSLAAIVAGQASALDLAIDTIAPQVSIVGQAAGALIDPRTPLAVTVQASDAGGVAEIGFGASGVAGVSVTRSVTPPSASRTETFTVPFDELPVSGGTLTLTASARDAAGNSAAAAPVTINVRDVVAPDVVSVLPAAGATGVEPTAPIVVRFSEAIDRASVTAASARVTSAGAVVQTTASFSDGDRTLTLTPASALKLNTTFAIEVSTQVKDAAGNALSSPLATTFKTKSPDVVSPKVATIVPADQSVNVAVGADVRVTFTEPIDPATISPASFHVAVSGAPIAGHFTFLDDNATVRFVPDAALPFDAVVVVELTSAITDPFQNPLVDANGNPPSTPITFTFLTGTFGITSPAQGSDVLESTPLTLEAQAGAALGLATVTFSVNGQALAPVSGPPFVAVYNVGTAAATPALTIKAIGRTAAGTQVAQDEVVVQVVPSLRATPRLVGVPIGGTGTLRLALPAPLTMDVGIQLSVVDPGVATVPSTVVIAAGATEVSVPVSGIAAGATTIVATSPRGNTWAVASVSPLVPKTMRVGAAPAGAVVVPARVLGHVFTPAVGQRTITVQLLSTAAVTGLPVTITSSNGAVATVLGAVTIEAGSRTATLTVVAGEAGTATLTLRAGNEVGRLTIVVGTADPALVPLTVASPAGVMTIPPPRIGRVFAAPAGQTTFVVTLLSSPAAANTAVTVTSSDAGIANVVGQAFVAAGSRVATVTVAAGTQGTAKLRFLVGNETREMTIVVGTPAAGDVPPIVASPVGAVAIEQRRLGTVISALGGRPAVNATLLSSPAPTATAVSVSSSDPNVAIVNGSVSIAAGSRVAALDILTGAAGVATLTLRAGNDVAQIVVVVGTPPASIRPVITAPLVGVEIKQQ